MEFENEKVFQLEDNPPNMKFQEYLSEYKKSKDIKFFCWFLHSYENKLNWIIKRFANRYSAINNLDDLKSIYVSTLFNALETWDREDTSDFLFENKFKLNDALIKHISEVEGAFSINSESHFKALRRVAFLYSNTVNLHGEELIEYISITTKLPLATVVKLIAESNLFYYYDDIYQTNDDGFSECYISSSNDNVEFITERNLLLESISDEIDNLSFKEQSVFLQSIGVDCHWCLRTCKRQTYMELANIFQLSDESAVEKLNKKARLALLTNLANEKILGFVSATRKSENKKTVTYTYLPQADKSAEGGVITINKADFSFVVELIAELDTMISTKYAKRVVFYLRGQGEFPKKIIYAWRE